jgi:glycosyltransferase involved in cell wall biosynthesis
MNHSPVQNFPAVDPGLPQDDPALLLSVVVPCFNEQDVLPELERRLCRVCDVATPNSYEIILVNDGSRDRTGEMIAAMAQSNPRIVGLELSRNFGHQIALTAGLTFARGQRIFVVDSDLQDPPELLAEMMRIMDGGANIVYGKRILRLGESRFKRLTSSLFYRLLNHLTEIPIPLDTGDFRLMDRKTLDVLASMPEQYRFVRGMVAWIGLNQVELPYERKERFAGVSKYPLKKMILFAIDAITGFSLAPLRLAFYLALFSILLAGMLAVYAFVGWLLNATVPGWTSILLLFLLFSSVQLACISIVGEYVGRTYMQTKHRPLFVLKSVHARSRGIAGDEGRDVDLSSNQAQAPAKGADGSLADA